jgi:hypothetical protein
MHCSLQGGLAWVSTYRQQGPQSNQHENMSCFSGIPAFVSASWKSHATKHEPQNLNFETYHPLKHITFRLAAQAPETCNMSIAMFQPHAPIFHVPHAIPIHAPWPIHEALNLFQLCIVTIYFFAKLWGLHRYSPAKYLLRVLITKRAQGDISKALFFHPH